MKYIKILIVLIFCATTIRAQNEVKISTKKINEHGITFYLHTVQKGETLYRISKAYRVDINDILYFNPELFNSIKEGQVIKIPEIREDDNYYYHLVKKKETVFSICKKYGITTDKLYAANPEIKTQGLKEATIIKIPKSSFVLKPKTFEEKEEDEKNYIFHVVQPKETLYSLAKKYNVSINDILEANPFLKDQGLKKYDTIKIPVKQKTATKPAQQKFHTVAKGETLYAIAKKYNTTIDQILKANPSISASSLKEGDKILIPSEVSSQPKLEKFTADTVKPTKLSDSLLIALDTIFNSCDTSHIKADMVNIILALPFGRVKIDNDPKKDYTDIKNFKNYPVLEFYEGFLVAMDSLKKKGMNITLNVFDIADTAKISAVIPEANLIYVYGNPVFEKAIIRQASHYDIPVINVFRATSYTYPKYIRLLASKTEKREALIHLLSKLDSANIIFMFPANDSTAVTFLSKIKQIADSKPSVTIKTAPLNEKEVKNIADYTALTTNNYLILWSFDEPQVTKYISKLALKIAKDKIENLSLIMMPEWKNYKHDYEYLHRLNAITITQTYTNYDTTWTHNFQLKYKSLFENIPTKYAFWGFDAGYYFTSAYSYFSTGLFKCLKDYAPVLLSTEFKISPTVPYHNISFFVIQYTKNYEQKILFKL